MFFLTCDLCLSLARINVSKLKSQYETLIPVCELFPILLSVHLHVWFWDFVPQFRVACHRAMHAFPR